MSLQVREHELFLKSKHPCESNDSTGRVTTYETKLIYLPIFDCILDTF